MWYARKAEPGLFFSYQVAMTLPPPCVVCPPTCESVFDRVVVSYLTTGATRVAWELLDTFLDQAPLTFQLQVGSTANPDADDWEDVGFPVVNQYFALDAEQRVWGKTNFTHYRVQVSSAQGEYVSLPVGGMGVLDRRMWRVARERIRFKKKEYKIGFAGQEGYLLKRRWTGEDCPVCLDYITKEVRNPNCPSCYGTGKRCGYYYPTACVWAKLSPKYHHTTLGPRATQDDIVVSAEMLMTELLGEADVWVAKHTDDRYFVHEVQHTEEIKGVPLIADVKLRPIPYSGIIYSIEIPQQLSDSED